MSGARVRITHTSTGIEIADGPIGWGITPFEGNYYIRRKFLQSDSFRVNFLPGICLMDVLVTKSIVSVYLASRCSARTAPGVDDRKIRG
jgi:hypothetical protein